MHETPNFDTALSKVIRGQREKLKLSRREVSEKTGISESHIKAIELGNRTPTVAIFVLMATALGLDADVLLREALQRQAYLNESEEQSSPNHDQE